MKFQIDYSKEKFKNRDVIVDNVKGLLTILFMLVHVTRNLPRTFTLSEWFYHSDPVLIGFWGFNILDLAPVAFYFVIGFVLWDATTRHYSQAGKKAYKNYILRNFTLIGIFLLLVYLQNSVQSVLQSNFKPDAWNYMAGIGFTGILVAPFLTSVFRTKGVLSLILKIVAAVVTLAVYGLLHDVLFKFFGTSSGSGGGIAASFGFVSTVILAGVMKDLEKKGILA
ncbi:MAG: hypothetical protein LBQ27_02245, partial [Clostridiales bacterium]|nr:hypothetical protein [Clostridiales bacterium]